MAEGKGPDDVPGRAEFRTFIGRQARNGDAVRAAHALLLQKRWAAGSARPSPSAPVPGQRPARLPEPAPAAPWHAAEQDPEVGRVVYAAGVSSAVAALLAVLICLPLQALSTPGGGPNAVTAVSPDPATAVEEFYDAVDGKDWRSAWSLGGSNLDVSYNAFVARYAGSSYAEDDVENTGGTTATAQLTVTASDGTREPYSGTYTVVDGVITSADVSPSD